MSVPELAPLGRPPIAQRAFSAVKCLLAAGVMYAPVALENAIEETTVNETFLGAPIELSYAPGSSSLNVLNTGDIVSTRTVLGTGVRARVVGLPVMTSTTDATNLFSAKNLALYSGLAKTPKDIIAGYEESLAQELVSNFTHNELPPALLGGGLLYLYFERNRAKQLGGATPQHHKRLIGGLATASLTISGFNYATWLESAQTLPTARIQALEGTSLEGVRVETPSLAQNAIERGVPYAQRLIERRDNERELYEAFAIGDLRTQIALLAPPRRDEAAVLTLSDTHASQAGIAIRKAFVKEFHAMFGEDALRVIVDAGDQGYDSLAQLRAIVEQNRPQAGARVVVSPGNHDGYKTTQYMRRGGAIVLDGAVNIHGLQIYGLPDPQQTPLWGGSFYRNNVTEQQLGQKAYDATKGIEVDILSLHQPAAVATYLKAAGIKNAAALPDGRQACISTRSMGVRLSPRLIVMGHTHDSQPPKTICNADGSLTVLSQLGTAGGAVEQPTPNNWSDPGAAPLRPLSFRLFYFNFKHRAVTGYIDVTFSKDGHLQPLQRIDISSHNDIPPSTKPNKTALRVTTKSKNRP